MSASTVGLILVSSLAILAATWLIIEALTLLDIIPQNHITAVVRRAYRKEPGVFILLSSIVSYIAGHFFWCSCG